MAKKQTFRIDPKNPPKGCDLDRVPIVSPEQAKVFEQAKIYYVLQEPPAEPAKRKNSRAKGARGERELAEFFRERGYPEARRGQQFSGGADSPDVVIPGLEKFHFEVKRVEAGNPYTWIAQAVRDAAGKKMPIVAHRKNGKEWLAILRLDDFLNLTW